MQLWRRNAVLSILGGTVIYALVSSLFADMTPRSFVRPLGISAAWLRSAAW
jgi:hypothetical protein